MDPLFLQSSAINGQAFIAFSKTTIVPGTWGDNTIKVMGPIVKESSTLKTRRANSGK